MYRVRHGWNPPPGEYRPAFTVNTHIHDGLESHNVRVQHADRRTCASIPAPSFDARSLLYCSVVRISSSRDLTLSLACSMDAAKRNLLATSERLDRARRRNDVSWCQIFHKGDIWNQRCGSHRPASCHESHHLDTHGYKALENGSI